MFPVPNTKEDIIEFLSIAMTSSKKKGGIFGSVGGRCVFFVALALIVFVLLGLAGGGEVGLLVGLLILGYGLMFSFVGGQDVIRENKIAQAWRDKFEQVMLKGRSLRGDAEFTQQLDYYESLLNQKK
ncbi:MAG: hypothetical protein MJZ63_04055 [Muribaculaceae bacterium]|nr:hypothetical protein [Muribaculaceae bacterium]